MEECQRTPSRDGELGLPPSLSSNETIHPHTVESSSEALRPLTAREVLVKTQWEAGTPIRTQQ